MQRYENLSGDSGVVAYEIGEDSIAVRFVEGTAYLYTYESAGAANVEQMKQLAREGRGLATFISRDVRDGYERKVE